VILDNLVTGRREFTVGRPFYEGDIADGPLVDRVFAEHPDIYAVIHCAALIVVPDSVADPVRYYRANVTKSLDFATHLLRNRCQRLIFSSSASIYRPREDLTVDEESPIDPQSPYARTKAICEEMFADIAAARPVRVLSLRYFNPIGADPKMRTGLQLPRPSHALGKMIEAAQAGTPFLITGTDYPTPDGRASGTTSTSGTWPPRTWPRWPGSTRFPGRPSPSTSARARVPPSGSFSTRSPRRSAARSRCARRHGAPATRPAPTPGWTGPGTCSAGTRSTTSPRASGTPWSGPRSATRSCSGHNLPLIAE